MKKLITLSLTATLLISSMSTAFAMHGNSQNMKPLMNVTESGFGGFFIDANGDGICDNVGSRMGSGSGGFFIDANGDGICDNVGFRMGSGFGGFFIDANGDGICDNVGSRMGSGRGCQLIP